MDTTPPRRGGDAATPPSDAWRDRLQAWGHRLRQWNDQLQEWKRQYPERKRQFEAWRRRPGPVITMVTVLAVTGLAGGAYALEDGPGSCDGKPLLLNVAAAADIAPSMLDVAARFNIQPHDVRGRCVRVEVQEQTSVSMARQVSGHGATNERVTAAAWVPDSSMWINVARSQGGVLSGEVTSIATSPVVLATPKQVADQLRKRKTKPSWRMMFPEYAELFGGRTSKAGVSVAMLDPVNSSSGVAAVIAARQVIGKHKRAPEILTTFVRNVQRSVSSDPWGLFTYLTGLASIGRPVVVATEQEVVDYNETHRKPAAALVPTEGTIVLDYPFVVTTKDPVMQEAAEAFRWTLQSRLAQETIQRAGFRSPQGIPDIDIARKYGLTEQAPKQLILPTSGQVNEALQAWNRLGLGSRILVLADVSSSMAQPVPGRGLTRMQTAINAALTGLQLFPDDTDIGLWTFATNVDGDRDQKELMSLGPITERLGKQDRRRTLQRVAPTIRTRNNDSAGLYDSILAGYQHVRQTWKPDKFNAVLVLTDGSNNGGKLSLNGLMDRLRTVSDPQHPLQVIIVTFGSDVDLKPMQQIARATNGSVYSTSDPGQIVNVFMEAIGRRLCTPNCPRQ